MHKQACVHVNAVVERGIFHWDYFFVEHRDVHGSGRMEEIQGKYC